MVERVQKVSGVITTITLAEAVKFIVSELGGTSNATEYAVYDQLRSGMPLQTCTARYVKV